MNESMAGHTAAITVSAYLDGELTPLEMADVGRHLEACPACRREYEALRDTGIAIREQLPRAAAPDLLRGRVIAALAEARAGAAAPAHTRRTSWIRQIAAGLVVAAASSALTYLLIRPSMVPEAAVPGVVASHIGALMKHHLTDVVSTDAHNVKPWFDGKVPFAPDVPRLDTFGFPLIGGRVDTVDAKRVAALVYGRRQHIISVFAWPTNHPGGADSVRAGSARGYNVLQWTHADMQYAAVSDVSMLDLRQFVEVFREGAPAGETERNPRE